ncbi:MAG: branched-chain amino acid ABC transporter permease [Actinomycetota bacterium]
MECFANIVDQFWGQLRNGLTLGSIYAMIALGYTLVYGVLQLINFAHSEVFMVSTVVTLFAFRNWFGVTHPLSGVALVTVLLVALVAAMLASAVTAVIVERLAYRPLRKHGAPRLSFLISAIGASLAIQYLFVLMDGNHRLFFLPLPNVLGPTPQSVPEVMSREPVFNLFGAGFSRQRILVIVVAVVMLVILDMFVHRTRLGRGIRAVAQDAETAAMMGVNIDRVVVTTFFIGGLMAGAAGLLFAVNFGIARWNIGFVPGIKAFTAAVLGGIGNIRGAMLGGLLLGMVEAFGAACTAPHWTSVITFLVLVGVLMFRPTGLLGERVAM